jgi:ribosomal 30S subunit maturation factor RimM
MEKAVAQIVGVRGLQGQVKIQLLTDQPEQRFQPGTRYAELEISGYQTFRDKHFLTFKDHSTRESVEPLVGRTLSLETDDSLQRTEYRVQNAENRVQSTEYKAFGPASRESDFESISQSKNPSNIAVRGFVGSDARAAGSNDDGDSDSLITSHFSLVSANAASYYPEELVGLQVLDTAGSEIGTVVEVNLQGFQDQLVVQLTAGDSNDSKRIIPFVKDLVPEVNLEQGWVKVNPIEGLL